MTVDHSLIYNAIGKLHKGSKICYYRSDRHGGKQFMELVNGIDRSWKKLNDEMWKMYETHRITFVQEKIDDVYIYWVVGI